MNVKNSYNTKVLTVLGLSSLAIRIYFMLLSTVICLSKLIFKLQNYFLNSFNIYLLHNLVCVIYIDNVDQM